MFKRGSGKAASGPAPGGNRGPMMMSKGAVIPKTPETGEAPASTAQPSKDSPTVEVPEHPKPGDVVSVNPESPRKKDLMISYSHADKDIMLKIRESLETNGISVWVDVSGLQAGVDFLSKIGEAIIDCKLFLSLVSESSVKSKYCQDELALAYVSNRAIFPVSLDTQDQLYAAMDTGMKLQLARYEWTELGRDENKFDERMEQLLKVLKEELQRQHDDAKDEQNPQKKDGRARLHRQKSRGNMSLSARASSKEINVAGLEPERYWKDNFGAKDQVPWEDFKEKFKKDFASKLEGLFDSEGVDWLMGILHREMEVSEEEELFKHDFLAFCNVEGEYFPLWDRVDEQARESWSMKEVFDMNSSVRVEAIENLGKFHSAAVIDALRDLLTDEDANVRAVAAVSLARTEVNDPVTCKYLMKTLNDKDRLVREAGCLALGHLKVKQAINKLLHLWRNDVISHVREAANVALSQIGGPEVEKQMKVTKVLADEIRQLTMT